ncbi:MAG: hypothetical protein ACRBCJ_05045 [Hyphomicrobiaceae bacterium]
MSVNDEAWSEILRLWTETSETPKAIGLRYGISHQLVVGRARSECWPDRPKQSSNFNLGHEADVATVDAPRVGMGRKGGKHEVEDKRTGEGQLLQRLHEAIERIVKQIEDRMSHNQEESIADTERLVRTLGTLIQNIGKIQDVDEQFQRRSSTAKSKQKTARDAERRRQELAERVCNILADRSSPIGK